LGSDGEALLGTKSIDPAFDGEQLSMRHTASIGIGAFFSSASSNSLRSAQHATSMIGPGCVPQRRGR
jgi:hypothetical protein